MSRKKNGNVTIREVVTENQGLEYIREGNIDGIVLVGI
jgi:hypothetical protein